MIHLTRLSQVPMVLNSDLIEHVEMTPDTVIFLTNGEKYIVRETPEQVIQLTIEFRRAILATTAKGNSTSATEPDSSGEDNSNS